MTNTSKLSKLAIALISSATLGSVMLAGNNSKVNADEIYTVKAGDTLSEISAKFGLNDYNGLAKSNHIKDVNVIEVGQKLVITDNGNVKQATTKDVQTLPEVDKSANNTQSNNSQKQAPAQQAPARTQDATNNASTTNVGGSASSVANAMAAKTGVSASTWQRIIMRESGGNGNISNASSGAYGYFQLLGHGEHAGMSAAEQVNMAASVYHAHGLAAWGE